MQWSLVTGQLTTLASAYPLSRVTTCTFGKHTHHLFFISILWQRGCLQRRCLGLSKDEEDMKTSRPVGAILAVLALTILRQLYHPTVNVNSTSSGAAEDVTVRNKSDSTIYKDTDGEDRKSDETNTQAEGRIGAQFELYSFHKACPCQRTAPHLSQLERHFNASTVEQARRSSKPWNPAFGSYVGNSTCNRHSTLGCSEI